MIDLSTLNENQLQAVRWGDGPLLVLAGPGSGKTRVLTFRIARLIQETPQKHFRILGLTFTNKAAAEMRERIETLVTNPSERTLLTTFHSFAADLLRQHGHHIGLKPNFTILVQEEDRHSILDEAINHAKAVEIFSTNRLLPLITRLIERDVNPESALQHFQNTSTSFNHSEKIVSVYKHYRTLMIQYNVLGFSELIAEALQLLNSHIGVRRQIQRVYSYVCVDEFQDTNLIQYKILRHLVNQEKNNLFVVADDDQTIYQWNGANPQRLWQLRQDFDMQLIQLPQNYRCPSDVVDSANRLISNNDRSLEKDELTAYKPRLEVSPVVCKDFRDFDEEVEWVATSIARRDLKARNKCVVLARTRRLLEKVIEALGKKDIVGYLAVRKNEFENASLQWLHSMLRLANERSSREHLQRVCKAFFTLEGINLNVKDIIVRSKMEDGDYLRAWVAASLERKELSNDSRELLQKSVKRLSERLDFWEFQEKALAWLDRVSEVSPDIIDIFDDYREEKQTWHQLVTDIYRRYEKTEVTLNLLLQELDLMSKSPAPPEGAVPCFTIHASKGMEFDHVYIIGLVEDQLPSWTACKKGSQSQEMQEERRNCFVAITRAKESLTLSYSKCVFGYPKRPSRFLQEMGLLR